MRKCECFINFIPDEVDTTDPPQLEGKHYKIFSIKTIIRTKKKMFEPFILKCFYDNMLDNIQDKIKIEFLDENNTNYKPNPKSVRNL